MSDKDNKPVVTGDRVLNEDCHTPQESGKTNPPKGGSGTVKK